MSDAPAVDVRAVVKRFGATIALDGLDLQVRTGEIHAFLGPNGAGKTTTLRFLLGLLRIDAGSASVLGLDPWADAVALHRRLAYVPGEVNLWPQLTGGEVIDLLGNLGAGYDQKRRDELVELFQLDPTKKARNYSKGNRQKVALVAALASDAELLLLDEPTAGLDPLMDATFRQCLREFRDKGGTVLLSSHMLSEAEALSDRVTIIREGKVMETGTLDQLRHLSRTRVTAEVHHVPDRLDSLDGVSIVSVEGTRLVADVDQRALSAFMANLAGSGLISLTSQPPTLEELFLRHYRETGGHG